jgi:hypothetical protein
MKCSILHLGKVGGRGGERVKKCNVRDTIFFKTVDIAYYIPIATNRLD